MTQPFRELGRHTLVYGAGIALNRLAGLLLLPVYTRFLTPSDYGVLELLSMTADIVGIISAMGLGAAVFKIHADYQEKKDRDEVISTAAVGLAAFALGTSILGFWGSPWINQVVFATPQPDRYFRLLFGLFLFQRLELMPLLLLRVRQHSVAFVLVNLGKLLLQLTLNIYLVVVRGWGVDGVLVGNLVATAISSTLLFAYLKRETGLRFSGEKLRRLVRFGFPLLFWALGNFAMISSDRFFLLHYSSTHAVGLYSLSYRFVGIMTSMAFLPFLQIWEPMRFEVAKREDSGEVLSRTFTYMTSALVMVSVLLSVGVLEVLRVMADPSFLLAYESVPILLAATVMFNWVAFSNLGLLVKERTDIIGWLSGFAVIVVLGLNLILIPRFGYIGAAWATLIAYAVRYIAVLTISQRFLRIDYEWARIFRLGAIFIIAVLGKSAVGSISIGYALGVDILLSSIAFAGVWFWVLSRWERALFLDAVRGGLRKMLKSEASGPLAGLLRDRPS